ncbi:DNA repair protein RecO C-terminal domain-containing protein [Rickettsiales bacterium]|nr:DNA repair protein RecO C-terminal domain-containing protein [Rickettsiales bacterium]
MKYSFDGVLLFKKNLQEDSALIKVLCENGIVSGFVKKVNGKKNRGFLSSGNLLNVLHYKRENGLGVMSCSLKKAYMNSCLDNECLFEMIASFCDLVIYFLGQYEGGQSSFEFGDLLESFVLFMDKCMRLNNNIDGIADDMYLEIIADFILLNNELLTLSGYGIDLSCCVVTGVSDAESLGFVSPKSGQAVSYEAGTPYKDVMLRLPKFFLSKDATAVTGQCIEDGIKIIDRFYLKTSRSSLSTALPISWERVKNVMLRIVSK